MNQFHAGFWTAFFCVTSIALGSAPQRPLDVKNYIIQMEIDPSHNPDTFQAQTEVMFKSLAPFDTLTLDAEQLNVSSVTLTKPTKVPLKFKVNADKNTLDIQLPGIMRKGETWAVAIEYSGKIRESHDGFFKVTDPDNKARGSLLFTQFESQSARKFFPCNDQPADKATTEVKITVPAGYDVLSNGKKIADKKVKKGRAAWHLVDWKMDRAQSTYLVAFGIGKFGSVATKADGSPVSVWVAPNQVQHAHYALDVTAQSLQFFNNYLGVRFPWPKYEIVGIPTFLWGGMENTSTTHQNERRTLLSDPNSEIEKDGITGLSAHELAHQWFGDYVTMAWWDDVWLNEAFASFMGDEATKHVFKNNEAEIENVADAWENYFRQEDGPRSHPIVDKKQTDADGDFDDISYTKGEQVLRMVRFWIGDAAFRKGLQMYLTGHAYGNATYVDFFNAMEKASGKPMAAFRDSWLLQRGYPVITYGGKWDDGAKTYTLNVSQKANHPEDKTLFQFALPVVFHRKTAPAYDTSVVVMMSGAKASQKVPLRAEPEWVTVNPGGVVLAQLTPADNDESKLILQAQSDPNDLARLWASYALFDGLRRGDSISHDAQSTLVQVITNDPSPYVRARLLASFEKIKDRWLPSRIGDAVLKLAKTTQQPDFEKSPLAKRDPHGARLWKSQILEALGRVEDGEALKLLSGIVKRKDVGLDDLSKGALAIAMIGDDQSDAMLKDALKVQTARGHAYQFAVEYAFGAYESPKAASIIAELAKTAGSDLFGRIGAVIRDNQTLKNSSEWAQFVESFILNDSRFGDEVKSRILSTIEEVKSDSVKSALQTIAKEAKSPRLQEETKKILGKNFSNT